MSHKGCPKCGASISAGKKCGSCGAVSLQLNTATQNVLIEPCRHVHDDGDPGDLDGWTQGTLRYDTGYELSQR